MPKLPFLYEWYSYLYPVQAAFTIWMLIDFHCREVDYYWFWIILVFQPFGAWIYFFLFKIKDFRGGTINLGNLFHRQPSLEELRYRVRQTPTVASWLALAERLLKLNQPEEALPHLEAVRAREPEHGRALFLLAQAHRSLGHPDQAATLLEQIVGRQPNWSNYAALSKLIEVCAELDDPARTLKHSRQLACLAPSLKHRYQLAEHLLTAEEHDEAREVLEQGLADYQYLSSSSRWRDRPWVGKAQQLLDEIDRS